MTTPTGKTALPLLQGLFAVTVWGASFIATKIALQDLSPMTIVVLRFFFGILVVAGAVVATGQFRRVPGNDVGYLALLGFIGISFHQWLQSTGLQTAQASTTAWLVSTTPVFMAILAYFMLKEKISILQAGGIFVAFAGVLLVVTNGDLGALTAGTQGGWGDLLVLVSAPNWALFSILSRRMLESYSASLTMLYVSVFGWLITTAAWIIGGYAHELAQVSFNGWLAILFLGILCSGFAYIFWFSALQRLKASSVGALLFLEPPVAVIAAAFFLGEPVTAFGIAGGVLIVAGVTLAARNGKG